MSAEGDLSATKDSLLKQVYVWASQNTQETRLATGFKYRWPEAAKRLLAALELSQGSIIALVGLSGVGKSSAQSQIAKALREKSFRAVHFKWPGYLDQNSDKILEFLEKQGIKTTTNDAVSQIIERALKKKTETMLKRNLGNALPYAWKDFKDLQVNELADSIAKYLDDAQNITPETLALKILGPTEYKNWKRNLVTSALSRCHSILLDLRDYATSDVRAMTTDLTEIQSLWQRIIEQGSAPNFVFVLQKELAFSSEAKVAHYFLGKARFFELKPFTPNDLVESYEQEFASTYPFEKTDLEFIARMSRGVFRRFLKYVQLCLETRIQLAGTYEEPISRKTIDMALSDDELNKEWETELRQIFPHAEHWKHASKIIKVLAISGRPFPQSELRNFIELHKGDKIVVIDESDLSRILSKLEEYGYVRRSNAGNKKLVQLNI